jgi:hypothetical protein
MNANNSLSIEFFPPKTPEGAEKLRAVRQALYPLKPQFCSVTYGAGGSTQAGTISTLNEILGEGMAAASHFSCIGATRDSVRQQLAEFKAMATCLAATARVASFNTPVIWWPSYVQRRETTLALKWRRIQRFTHKPNPLKRTYKRSLPK